ncbi:MAG: hypothetical protein F4229_15650 [Gammaproteobacteria bacterium]|nr:hypothetical protein [Gammaproteobacteria bacterium]
MKKLGCKSLQTLQNARRWLLAAALSACGPAIALEPGQLTAENLNQQSVEVPGDLPPNAVLLVGFSRDANAEVRPWWEALQAARSEHDFTPYNVSVIEGAPGFMQSMIRRGMREQAKPSRKDYLLLVTEGAEAWRALFGAQDDAAAHVVRFDEGGGICLRHIGPLTDDALLAIVSGECDSGQPSDDG